MERGRQSPRLDHLAAVAGVLGTTAGHLVDGSAAVPREDALPREISRLLHVLRAKDAVTQRKVRELVEIALGLGGGE